MRKNVLVADDHPLLRAGLRSLVQSCPECHVVGEASTGREAIQAVLALQPDLLFLDLTLPDMAALDVVTIVQRRARELKIIAMGDTLHEIAAREVLRAGCAGYLLKDTSLGEVALAIATVMAGRCFICQDMATELVGTLVKGESAAPAMRAWQSLTLRERSVFRLVAQGRTNRSAAEQLNLSPKTVEKHRASVMRKLDVRNAVELTLLAVELGVVERPK